MPITEKEYNGNLLDRLTAIERIERQLKKAVKRLQKKKLKH